MKHIVIAMNHVMGLSFVRHHHLPKDTIVVCGLRDVIAEVEHEDIHELAIHVAGDRESVEHDVRMFQSILWRTTRH
jgi:hypothetical protein